MGKLYVDYIEGSVKYFTREPAPEKFDLNRIVLLPGNDEGLTGVVQNLPASDLEERFSRALEKNQIPYEFQKSFLAPNNMPGSYKLDFLVYVNGQEQPVAIDGEYAHKSAAQHANDTLKDEIFNDAKKGEMLPVMRIKYTDLDTQDMADAIVEQLWM
jgi:hypothetical protein